MAAKGVTRNGFLTLFVMYNTIEGRPRCDRAPAGPECFDDMLPVKTFSDVNGGAGPAENMCLGFSNADEGQEELTETIEISVRIVTCDDAELFPLEKQRNPAL